MSSKMIKLKFKKRMMWLYLFPSCRRWLRECEKAMNRPSIQKEIEDTLNKQNQELVRGFVIINPDNE